MGASGEAGKTDVTVGGHKGAPIPMRTLFYDRSSDREVHLIATPDGMNAYMKVIPGAGFSGLTRESVVAIVASAGVLFGLLEAGIALLVATQNSPTPFSGFCQVARGEPMRKGENGSIEFHIQPTSMEPRYEESDSGTIDYKHLNLIENCFAGQRVASVLPPGPGRPGKNIFGTDIDPVSGEPVAVQAGPGIVTSSNGREFASEIEGRLVFEEGVLSVSPLLEIRRDIDYSVGNVDFVGNVKVNGSLLDGFYVNAKRGVEIRGDVGASRITSEGDVVITGGIKGKNAAIVTCRSLKVHYIDDATVEASGHVAANKEIMNSSVKALGRVSVAQGAIIGGEVCGFQGVEADTLGSDMGIATWVMAGLNWTDENRKDEIRSASAELLERVHSAQVLLDPLFQEKDITLRLGSEQKTVLSELISELRDIRDSLSRFQEERSLLDGREQVGMINQINVRKNLFMGVSTRFSQVDGQVKDSVKGPVSLTQDTASNAMRIGPLQPLPPIAAEEAGEGRPEARPEKREAAAGAATAGDAAAEGKET